MCFKIIYRLNYFYNIHCVFNIFHNFFHRLIHHRRLVNRRLHYRRRIYSFHGLPELINPNSIFRPHLFLYREQNLRHAAALLPAPPAPAITLHQPSYRPPFFRPLPSLPRNRHLARSCFTGISITPPAALPLASLFSKALPASHQSQLPSSAFCNPKMHPHQ